MQPDWVHSSAAGVFLSPERRLRMGGACVTASIIPLFELCSVFILSCTSALGFPFLQEPLQENTRAERRCIRTPRRLCVPVNWGQPASVVVELCGEGEQVNKMSLRTTFTISFHHVASSCLGALSHWAKNRFLPANDLHLVPVGKTH